MAATIVNKDARLEARITGEQKELFARAAALRGQSLTEFVVSSLQEAAEEAIRTHTVITLSQEASVAFAQALLDPPPPNDKLRAAAERYRAWRGASS